MGSGQLRITLLALLLAAVPYLGLRLYLSFGMHASAAPAALPPGWLLGSLFVLGVVVPTTGVLWILRWILRDRLQFQLSGLVVAYAALILLFASSYAILQASRVGPSFAGMPVLWEAHDPATLVVHVRRLHEIFFESVYLSTMTITTVGYGDLVPLTRLGKLLTAVEGLAGIGFMGIALGHYFSVCLRSDACSG